MGQISGETSIYIAINRYQVGVRSHTPPLAAIFVSSPMTNVGAEQRGPKRNAAPTRIHRTAFTHYVCSSKICLESVFIGSVMRCATIPPHLFPSSHALCWGIHGRVLGAGTCRGLWIPGLNT